MQSLTVSVPPVNTIAAAQFQLGRERFTVGEQLVDCTCDDQRRGWWNELKATADADTYAYLSGGRS